jgi:hypothetical protein
MTNCAWSSEHTAQPSWMMTSPNAQTTFGLSVSIGSIPLDHSEVLDTSMIMTALL